MLEISHCINNVKIILTVRKVVPRVVTYQSFIRNLSSTTVLVKEKLFLQEGAVPKFYKLYKLPFALKPVERVSLTD